VILESELGTGQPNGVTTVESDHCQPPRMHAVA
jgi:hypothetical protein